MHIAIDNYLSGRVVEVCGLQVGRMMQACLVEGNRQKCGYAAVADVATGQLIA